MRPSAPRHPALRLFRPRMRAAYPALAALWSPACRSTCSEARTPSQPKVDTGSQRAANANRRCNEDPQREHGVRRSVYAECADGKGVLEWDSVNNTLVHFFPNQTGYLSAAPADDKILVLFYDTPIISILEPRGAAWIGLIWHRLIRAPSTARTQLQDVLARASSRAGSLRHG